MPTLRACLEGFPRPWNLPVLRYAALEQDDHAENVAAQARPLPQPRDLDPVPPQAAPEPVRPQHVQRQQPRARNQDQGQGQPPNDPPRRLNALLDIDEANVLPIRLRPRPQRE